MANPQSSSVWLPGVVLLVVAGTSYLIHENAYQTSRPVETKTRSKQLLIPEEVDARLWQDPLYALDQHLKGEESTPSKANQHHLAATLKNEIVERLEQLPSVTKPNAAHKAKSPKTSSAPASTDDSLFPQDLTLLAVMVPKAPYAEPAERRRRIRYAVLSGLNRSGLVPEDPEHIAFFTRDTRDVTGEMRAEYITYEFMQRTGPAKSKRRADANPGGETTETVKPPRVVGPVVVLWIPTEGSQRCVQSWLSSIFGAVAPPIGNVNFERIKFTVLGPPESGTLAEMVREAIAPERCRKIHLDSTAQEVRRRMQFYSPWASAAGNELAHVAQDELSRREIKSDHLESILKPCVVRNGFSQPAGVVEECDIEEILKISPSPVRLVRLIGDDVLLSNALLNELALRGVNPSCAAYHPQEGNECFDGGLNRHRIAIVSEWDAPYQRALRLTLARVISERCGRQYGLGRPCDPPAKDKVENWLLPFSYLRGLDGQIADVSDASVKHEDDSNPKAADPNQPFGEIGTVERADGNAQFDYIRRLVQRIERKDRQLRESGQSAIGAIGVLGTDPYDKLTILQALHEHFADKLFFTSNLDARLLHPRESKWARNLIVVSAFDLELEQGLQRDIPPLRDGYQTAAYFATMFAMRDREFDESYEDVRTLRCVASADYDKRCRITRKVDVARSWFAPLVFEVARTRAVRLERTIGLPDRKSLDCDSWDFKCIAVQPTVQPTGPIMRDALRPWAALAVGVAIALAGMLLVQAAKPRPFETSEEARRTLQWRVAIVAILAVAGAVLALAWNWIWTCLTQSGMGEPGLVFEGVSIWPAEIIRLLIIGLAIAFMFRSHKRLSSNREDIVKRFGLARLEEAGAPDRAARSDSASPGNSLSKWLRQRLASGWLCLKHTCSMRAPINPSDVESLWSHYLQDGRACARLCRVFFYGLLLSALSAAAFEIWPDVARFRGEFSFQANRLIFALSVLTFNLLVFYVVDALIICNRCVKRLNCGLDWSLPSYAKFEQHLGQRVPLKEWMTVQFIASRTEAVGALVYMPFILLFLIIIARNSVFGHWDLTPSVVVLLSVSAAILLFAALRLRWTTEAARGDALESLTDRLIIAKGQTTDDKLAHQLELMISEVKELRQGAFAPYTDQKFIRALLLPLAGLASTALIEYMSLVKP